MVQWLATSLKHILKYTFVDFISHNGQFALRIPSHIYHYYETNIKNFTSNNILPRTLISEKN
jgi:hypothetical protein